MKKFVFILVFIGMLLDFLCESCHGHGRA